MKKPSSPAPRLIDPNDPLFDSIESTLVGLTPQERFEKLFAIGQKTASASTVRPRSTSGLSTGSPVDSEGFTAADREMAQALRFGVSPDAPSASTETEEDSIRAEAQRRERVRRLTRPTQGVPMDKSKVPPDPTPDSSK